MAAEAAPVPVSVEDWLADLNNPAPDAPSLATFVRKQAKNESDALLRLSNVVLTLDACLKGSREANKELREERDVLFRKHREARSAVQDLAHTATLMIDRISQVDAVAHAAIALRTGAGTQAAFDDAVTVYMKILEARS